MAREYGTIDYIPQDCMFSDEMYIGMPVRVLGLHSTGGVMVTLMGLNNYDTRWEEGWFDSLVPKSCLRTSMLRDGEGFTGFIFPNGDWMMFGGGQHSNGIRYLKNIGYDYDKDDTLIFSSVNYSNIPEYLQSDDYVHGNHITEAQWETYTKYVEEYTSVQQDDILNTLAKSHGLK